MKKPDLHPILVEPIGFVRRASPLERERDRRLIAQIVVNVELAPGLDGIEEWSHIYVIYWLDRVVQATPPVLHHPGKGVGIFTTRAPIHPNPVGLTLVELVERDGNVLWVRGLDAFDGTPVLDIKPYPDWEGGRLLVVTDFKVPGWLTEIIARQVQDNGRS